jgi:hypothetical protein
MYKFVLLAVVFVLLSCKDNVKKIWYDTGELLSEETVINKDSIYSVKTEYYKNGNKKAEDFYKIYNLDTLIDGFSKRYYSDGSLKWQGYIKKGTVQISKDGTIPNYDALQSYIKEKDNQKEIELYRPFIFRIYVDEINPVFYKIITVLYTPTKSFLKIQNDLLYDDDYPYNFTLTVELLEDCYKGLVRLNKNCDCNSVDIVVLLPTIQSDGELGWILSDNQPKKTFNILVNYDFIKDAEEGDVLFVQKIISYENGRKDTIIEPSKRNKK